MSDLVADLRAWGEIVVEPIDVGPLLHDALNAADEIERLRSELDAAQLRSIEARNPGIDMDDVRRRRASGAA